jgi:hypothetical protein
VVRAVILAGVVALAGASSASAGERKTIASYCSPSGDVCFGIVRRSGVLRFEITTAARYFARYTLCVRPPGMGAAAKLRCGSFPIFRGRPPTWYGSVRFRPTFPGGPPGVYRVSWRLGSGPLGPTLRFRR